MPGGVGVVCIRIPAIILLFSEITVVLVRFKHIPSVIVNANDEWVRAGVSLRMTDSGSYIVIAAGASEWQLI